jgi:hypothetical protein
MKGHADRLGILPASSFRDGDVTGEICFVKNPLPCRSVRAAMVFIKHGALLRFFAGCSPVREACR